MLLLTILILLQSLIQGLGGYQDCIDEYGEGGVCLPFNLCGDDGKVISNGAGLLNVRRISKPCSNLLHQCCMSPPEYGEDAYEEDLNEEVSNMKSTCGIHNPDGVDTTVDLPGNVALFGEFPWLVSIRSNGVRECSGSLIRKDVVLTTASSIKELVAGPDLLVRAGDWEETKDIEVLRYQDHEVKEIIRHEKYNHANLKNNIALLILKTSVKLNSYVGLACLPGEEADAAVGRCLAAGWENSMTITVPKKVDLPIVRRPECQRLLRKTRLGSLFKLDRSFICAGGEEGLDMCTGAGGSPLFCPNPGTQNEYSIYGMVSWGVECGRKGIPGVYTNVKIFRQWIEDRIMERET